MLYIFTLIISGLIYRYVFDFTIMQSFGIALIWASLSSMDSDLRDLNENIRDKFDEFFSERHDY